MAEWTPIGGKWEMGDGFLRNHSDERGAKLLTGSSQWRNLTVNADVRFDGGNADMGVTVRSNDETEGVDAYNGYYVGLRTVDGTIVIGRSDYGWVEVRPLPMPGGLHPSVWYRMRVTAYECNIAASVENLTTHQTAWIAYEERSCVETGRIGMRSLNAGATWRNISVTGAGRNDYLELRQHAASVERPQVPPGPPWWTPWHVGVLFASALALALLTQLAVFRIQRWKAYAIMQERERLAHEIHDTMAQSFAGVGYQIQGIRRAVLRGDRLDSDHIAEQLSDAYQLVRRCHEEASRTVATLAAPSHPAQHNLVAALAETADKIAGKQIDITANVSGNPAPLNQRLADALLHIGKEAIANAVSHADPTELAITLTYDGSDVELTVEDNGSGFECKPGTAGFGILGMQRRARDVSGTLEIESTPGHGTRVRMKASVQQQPVAKRILALVAERVLSPPPDFNLP
jgi:signal transduction histidine kinase